jgi:hypothetical protein
LQLFKKPVEYGRTDQINYARMFYGTGLIKKKFEINYSTAIRAIKSRCKKISDARLSNKITKQEMTLRMDIPAVLKEIISKILRPH